MSYYNPARGLRSKNRRIRRKCRRAIMREARTVACMSVLFFRIASAAREMARLMSLSTLPFAVLTALREPLQVIADRSADATARPEIRAAGEAGGHPG